MGAPAKPVEYGPKRSKWDMEEDENEPKEKVRKVDEAKRKEKEAKREEFLYKKKPGDDLVAGCKVEVHSLGTAKEHNGKSASLLRWDDIKLRWQVELSTGEKIKLKPENLNVLVKLVVGSRVEIYGLNAKKECNGKIGVCKEWDPDRSRWKIDLQDGGEKLNVKPLNLICLDEVPAAQPA